MSLNSIQKSIHRAISPFCNPTRFFKTKPGEYGAHDIFIGVTTPNLRAIAKEFNHLSLSDLEALLASPVNEERITALFIMINQYKRGSEKEKSTIYEMYVKNISQINNWNLVDSSAHLILGAHIEGKDTIILEQLAISENIWKRRIAIVATWHFIRKNNHELTINIAKILLHDSHDLIHKSVGWMLRESGKRDLNILLQFLDIYAHLMPRTMLRYALEKVPHHLGNKYLAQKTVQL